MNEKKDSVNAIIRKKAKKFITKNPFSLKSLQDGDIQSLVEELRIHQVELEMQNEELRRAQLELQEARDKYLDLFDFSPSGYFTVNHKGLIVDVNLRGAEMAGLPRSRLMNRSFYALVRRNSTKSFPLDALLRMGDGEKLSLDLWFGGKKEGSIHARLDCVAATGSEGRLIRVAMTDLTELKRAEDALINANIGLEMRVHERTEELRRANVALREEVAVRKKAEIELMRQRDKLEDTVRSRTMELTIRNSELAREVGERTRLENEAAAARDEKDALLKELQHRVRNNLTMIQGMIYLKGEETGNAELQDLLDGISRNIQILSVLYGLLGESGFIKKVNLDTFFNRIADLMADAFSLSGRITVDRELECMEVDSGRATLLGIVLNELITNSLKHGFPEGKSGSIRIHLRHTEGGLTLEVGDDGLGLPDGFALETSERAGLGILKAIVHQLNGTVKVDAVSGKKFLVTIPLP